MKKIILKTALITFGVTVILAIAVFGITSFCAPSAMMNFTASLGMESISGDYAYQEYERSGNLECLSRPFIIAAEKKDNRTANDRFTVLYGEDGSERREEFEAFCIAYKVENEPEGVQTNFREYLMGLAAGVKYRIAKTEEGKSAACDFAIEQTVAFTAGSPAAALTLEIVSAKDGETAFVYLGKIREQHYEESETYSRFIKFLEGTVDE